MNRASRPPHDGIVVVEHEFEGGPLAGRRMTGLASTFDLRVERSKSGRRVRLVASESRRCIGAYRFERKYDCARSSERVHAYRW
ncbi:MAG: hypothetical protein JF589_16830, partial [Gemmatimonadetes bacterium]|nr:hypothetical protein [Gemmatimonadota bacterium]